MQLSTIRNFILASAAICALAACETTTNGENGGNGPPICVLPEVLNEAEDACILPPEPPVVSSNGLRFADGEGLSKDDLDDTTLTLRAARLIVTGDEGDKETASAELIDLEIISSVNEGDNWIITVDFGDDEILLVDTSLQNDPFYCPTSTAGIEYCFDTFKVTDNIATLVFYGGMGPEEDWDSRIVGTFIGLETDPDVLEGKGLATYYGGFLIEVVSTDYDFWVTEGGLIVIDADFAAAEIDGNLDGNGWDTDFAGEIDGNTWTADATDHTIADIGDDQYDVAGGGEFQLDGVFYGATGEETAGTIIVDVEMEVDPDIGDPYSFDLTGAGGFVACEAPLECFD